MARLNNTRTSTRTSCGTRTRRSIVPYVRTGAATRDRELVLSYRYRTGIRVQIRVAEKSVQRTGYRTGKPSKKKAPSKQKSDIRELLLMVYRLELQTQLWSLDFEMR
eukprot:scaffold105966_cov32-Prasinocladus_malaysianus.AAC.2